MTTAANEKMTVAEALAELRAVGACAKLWIGNRGLETIYVNDRHGRKIAALWVRGITDERVLCHDVWRAVYLTVTHKEI